MQTAGQDRDAAEGEERASTGLGLRQRGRHRASRAPSSPAASIRTIVAFIFLFGAVYVILTVKLLYRIIAELTA